MRHAADAPIRVRQKKKAGGQGQVVEAVREGGASEQTDDCLDNASAVVKRVIVINVRACLPSIS